MAGVGGSGGDDRGGEGAVATSGAGGRAGDNVQEVALVEPPQCRHDVHNIAVKPLLRSRLAGVGGRRTV